MNEKFRNILERGWNEPRHFFLWLAASSVGGLAIAGAAHGYLGTNTFFGTVGVLSVLGLLVGIPAFILACIPPVRRVFAAALRWRFLILATTITVVALFYAVEDWRGRHAWQTYKRDREAKGERFDLASYVPKDVPEDQNYWKAPVWKDVFATMTNQAAVDDLARASRVPVYGFLGPNIGEMPPFGNIQMSRRTDLAAWQAFFRGTNNQFAGPDGTVTNYYPVAETPQSPAKDVLMALSRFDAQRQMLLEASARPKQRFPVDYEAGLAMIMPPLACFKDASQYLSLHAIAALQAGENATALEDLRLSLRLLEALRVEPTLIAQLVRIAILQRTLQPIWEGLTDRRWTAADLASIQSDLGKLDLLADYHLAMRGERAFNLWVLDYLKRYGIYGLQTISGGPDSTSGEGTWFDPIPGKALPAGWYDQNKLSISRAHERYSLPAVDLQRHIAPPEAGRRAAAALTKRRLRPYDMFSGMLLPAFAKAAERFALAQATVDLARVACALERYRLASSRFPETLDVLAPDFIDKVPHDVINGQPLKYHLRPEGSFVLYSVGWNEVDDSGHVALRKGGTQNSEAGDWVWSYPSS